MDNLDHLSMSEQLRHLIDTATPIIGDELTRTDVLTLCLYMQLNGQALLVDRILSGDITDADTLRAYRDDVREQASQAWQHQFGNPTGTGDSDD